MYIHTHCPETVAKGISLAGTIVANFRPAQGGTFFPRGMDDLFSADTAIFSVYCDDCETTVHRFDRQRPEVGEVERMLADGRIPAVASK
jgi:hypothetical protein